MQNSAIIADNPGFSRSVADLVLNSTLFDLKLRECMMKLNVRLLLNEKRIEDFFHRVFQRQNEDDILGCRNQKYNRGLGESMIKYALF